MLMVLVGCATLVENTNSVSSGNGLWGELYRLSFTNRIIGPLDGSYECFTYQEWLKWIPKSKLSTRTNAWDCDDYALEAMVDTKRNYRTFGTNSATPAIGLVIGKLEKSFLGMNGKGLHALNIIYVKEHGWMFYEPQNGRTALVRDALKEGMISVHWVIF